MCWAVGNKLDLVQGDGSSSSSNGDDSSTTIVPSTDSDATGTPSASSSDEDDEADDATATPAAAESHGAGKNRQVPKEEAAAYAQEAGLLFFETSAKTGEGIVDVFTELGAYPFYGITECQAHPCPQPRRSHWSNIKARAVAQARELCQEQVEALQATTVERGE